MTQDPATTGLEAEVYVIRRPLTLAQVAEVLQVSVKTVRRRVESGEIRAFQAAERGTWRVRPEWLEEYMEAGGHHRQQDPRPLAHVGKVDPSKQPPAPRRPRRRSRTEDSGTLTVKPGMGRAA